MLYRKPHKTAIDPDTGEEYDDLLVIRTANADDKHALVAGDGPFFTIDHFKGFNAVLVQQSRLGEITRDELAEVITDAWLATRAEEAGPASSCDRAELPAPRSTRPAGGVRRAGAPSATDDAYANLVLPRLLRERGITGRDAAFATELVGGTLRGQGSYDAVIDHLRRPRAADPAVRDALRLGAHQLLGDAGARRTPR